MIEQFQTSRLMARPMVADDLDLIVGLNSDAAVMKFITGRGLSRSESEDELQRALGARWIVCERATHMFLGWVGAHATADAEYDIGWRLRRAAWGHGYATEAADSLLDYLYLSEGAQRVSAQTMAVNTASLAVMNRLGLRYVRTFHLEFDDPLPGAELGEVEYGLTRESWLERRRH